ncbi:hypothetical protein ACO2I3_09870 [Leptospira interrogans]
MNPNATALLGQFEAAAETAQETEIAVRKKLADEVARLERERTFAFRRVRLVRTLLNAAEVHDSESDALMAERRAICNELDWNGETEMQSTILDRLQPVALGIWKCTCADTEQGSAEITQELQAFETWHETAYGKSFYALFDRYVPQVPVVDF